jgi:tetratricopeptide (TPR) repeat protein
MLTFLSESGSLVLRLCDRATKPTPIRRPKMSCGGAQYRNAMPNGADLVPPSRRCVRNAHGINVRAWQSGITVLAAAGLVLAACAHVLAADDREECATTGNLDQSIAACGRVIADDAETAANRAAAYKNRGDAYYSRKDYDRAIADYNEAIKLDPSQTLTYHVLAYVNRGIINFDKKDYDRAIVDFSEAIKLDPKHAVAHKRARISQQAGP